MSSILTRMAQQALGTAPTVQPVTAAQFAPGTRSPGLELFEPLEPAPHANPVPRDAAAGTAPGADSQAAGAPLSAPADQSPPVVSAAVPVAVTRAEPAQAERRPQAAPPPTQGSFPAREAATARAAPAEGVQRTRAAAAWPKPGADGGGTPSPWPRLAQPTEPPSASRREARSDITPGDAEQEREPRGHILPAPAPPLPQRTPAAGREASAARAGQHAQPRTEIHITIGSVELRAPPVAAKPAGDAFRPQVTLGDYLQRRGGGA